MPILNTNDASQPEPRKPQRSRRVVAAPAPLVEPPVKTKTKDIVEAVKHKIHDLDGKMLHVKVGDISWTDMSMLQSEIDKVQDQIQALVEENDINCAVFVTHWAVEVKVVESAKGKKD